MQVAYMESKIDFADYYHKYYNEMYYVANSIVHNHYSAEDVVQDAFIKAYKSLAHLTDPSKCRAWLRTIVIRTAIDHYRKKTKYHFVSVEEAAEMGQLLSASDDGRPDQFSWLIKQDYIIDAIESLPAGMQMVLMMKIQTDSKDQDIADALNISLSAVKTRLHRARKILKDTCNQL